MSANTFLPPIFTTDGLLRHEVFEPSAFQLLEQTQRWLAATGRATFLPIDLLVVLVQQREPTISRAVARLVRGSEDAEGLGEQLASLARKIERREAGIPQLHAASFSLGFTGILSDAWDWADEAGRERIAYRDLVRVMRWRAEYQESASVRWALRQMIQPAGERIFDSSGLLLEPLFSPSTLASLVEGVHLSVRAGLPFLGTPHFIAALCSNRRSLLWRSAESAAVDPLRVRDELLRIVGQRQPELPAFSLNRRTLTPRVVRVLVAAHEQAEGEGRLVEEGDLLDAFLEDGGSSLELLRALGVESRLRERLSQRPVAPRAAPHRPASGGRVVQMATDKEPGATLDSIGRDLSAEARAGRLQSVLGRDDELQRVINVLMRTEQRNPLLTGEPGVGKTAIASALAQAIVDERVPAALRGMRVIELNGASLVGGTSFRGELEERIGKILHEAEERVILFMDEAHAVFAPTATGGRPAEVPNHFKAALASGKIAVVAATTDAEYQRWFEQDPALKRRFERIHVAELPAVVTRRILADLSRDWETRYEVMIPDDAIDAAVELSMRFLPELSQPDKAKKLLMDSAIALASSHVFESEDVREAERPILQRRHVAEKLSRKTGIPLARIVRGRSEWWRGLSDRLNDRVPGHRSIAQRLTQHLLSSRIGQPTSRQNQSSFVFSGPSSPAKEQFARALSEEMFGTGQAFLKLDMSDFQDPHSISRLLGSPPGYVGYQDEDALVTPLRRHPAQVVYLSDFHLCHPQIRDRILRMLEDGEITDMRGMRADCRHAVFVLAVDTEESRGPIGFSDQSAEAHRLSALPKELGRRLAGRALEIIPFGRFDDEDRDQTLRGLLESGLEQTKLDFREAYAIDLTISSTLVHALLEEAKPYGDTFKVQQLIQSRIVRPVIEAMLAGHDQLEGITVTTLQSAFEDSVPVADSPDISEAYRSDS